MLPHQFVFLGEHRGSVYIKKINANYLTPKGLSYKLYMLE